MKKFFYQITLCFTLVFVGMSVALATTYYRGDTRTPEEIKAAGGFYPPTYSGGAPSLPLDMSLYEHVQAVPPNTGYVSTSSDETRARRFALGGYVYFVQGDRNLVDAAQVLGAYYQRPSEREFAALGGIPWNQIDGWRRVDGSGSYRGPFIENPDYAGDEAFSGNPNPDPAQVVPLAGFPYNHPAWGQAPWNQYPFTGCGSFLRATANAASADQCDASERVVEWKYLSQYRASRSIVKKVISKGSVNSSGLVFPSDKRTWIDMDGSGYLSWCGLFYDSEGSRTKITCSRNKDGSSFEPIVASLGDYGWNQGRSFTVQANGKVGYCRLIYINTHLACAQSTTAGYFASNVEGGYIDGGYPDARFAPAIYEGGKGAFCTITGTAITGFYMNCDRLTKAGQQNTSFYLADAGWAESRTWLDIKGLGPGREAFCRFVGATTYNLQCTLRTSDVTWSADITSAKVDYGYVGYRYAVRMGGPAQEFCRVTGGYREYLTCTYLDAKDHFVNYAVALPRSIDSSTQRIVKFTDVDGDGRDDLCFYIRKSSAIQCYLNTGRAFMKKTIQLPLSNSPVGDLMSEDVKIMPINYTKAGPVVSVCYNAGRGEMTCDKFLVY